MRTVMVVATPALWTPMMMPSYGCTRVLLPSTTVTPTLTVMPTLKGIRSSFICGALTRSTYCMSPLREPPVLLRERTAKTWRLPRPAATPAWEATRGWAATERRAESATAGFPARRVAAAFAREREAMEVAMQAIFDELPATPTESFQAGMSSRA